MLKPVTGKNNPQETPTDTPPHGTDPQAWRHNYTTNAGLNKTNKDSGNNKPHPRGTNKKIVATPQNKIAAKTEMTEEETNKNLNKTKRTKFLKNALPKSEPSECNEPTPKGSPNKSAAIDPATTKNAFLSTHHTDLHNRQDQTTIKVAQTRTTCCVW